MRAHVHSVGVSRHHHRHQLRCHHHHHAQGWSPNGRRPRRPTTRTGAMRGRLVSWSRAGQDLPAACPLVNHTTVQHAEPWRTRPAYQASRCERWGVRLGSQATPHCLHHHSVRPRSHQHRPHGCSHHQWWAVKHHCHHHHCHCHHHHCRHHHCRHHHRHCHHHHCHHHHRRPQ